MHKRHHPPQKQVYDEPAAKVDKYDEYKANHVLNWNPDNAKRAYEIEVLRKETLSNTCPHSESFWKSTKGTKYGKIIFCESCGQFFAKVRCMPCLAKKQANYEYQKENGRFYIVVHPRLI